MCENEENEDREATPLEDLRAVVDRLAESVERDKADVRDELFHVRRKLDRAVMKPPVGEGESAEPTVYSLKGEFEMLRRNLAELQRNHDNHGHSESTNSATMQDLDNAMNKVELRMTAYVDTALGHLRDELQATPGTANWENVNRALRQMDDDLKACGHLCDERHKEFVGYREGLPDRQQIHIDTEGEVTSLVAQLRKETAEYDQRTLAVAHRAEEVARDLDEAKQAIQHSARNDVMVSNRIKQLQEQKEDRVEKVVSCACHHVPVDDCPDFAYRKRGGE